MYPSIDLEAAVHVLTKIFVVFVSFLSVLLVALTVAYASNAGVLVQQVQSLEDQVKSLSSTAAVRNAERNRDELRIERELNDTKQLVMARDRDISELREREAQLSREKAMVAQEIDQLEAQLSQLISTNQTQTRLIEQLSTEVNQRRETELALQSQNIELQDSINDLMSQAEVKEAQIRALQERIAQAEREAEDGGEGLRPVPAVFGSVLAIRTPDAEAGDTYVEIDLGSSDQLVAGHELLVVRGSQYVGAIRIIRTDVNRSVGKVERLARDVNGVQEGDQVRTGPQSN
jgi:vacuolar-type H+-ATPase subunit I/STV1